jgi:hypothetical protein
MCEHNWDSVIRAVSHQFIMEENAMQNVNMYSHDRRFGPCIIEGAHQLAASNRTEIGLYTSCNNCGQSVRVDRDVERNGGERQQVAYIVNPVSISSCCTIAFDCTGTLHTNHSSKTCTLTTPNDQSVPDCNRSLTDNHEPSASND